MNAREAKSFNQVFHSARHYDFGSLAGESSSCTNDTPQGGHIEMIHVRVGEENHVDGRERLHHDARTALPAKENQAL